MRRAGCPTLAPDVLALFALSLAGQFAPARQRAAHRGRDGGRRATITRDHLSDDFLDDCERASRRPAIARRAAGAAPVARRQRPVATGTLEEVEVETIRRAVQAAGGNISEASKRLGISRNTIYRKLRWNAPA